MQPRGEAFDEAWLVYGHKEVATGLLRDGLLELPATQALVQALHGRGNVSVGGALHVLAKLKLADPDDATAFRRFLQTLNDLGIVAYSSKFQTVRIVAEVPVAPIADEAEPAVRIVTPDRPYQNVRHLMETLRACKEFIWWAEPHFTKKMLEPLHDEADATKVTTIRLLTGPAQSASDTNEVRRFAAEMKSLGIAVEWRTVETRDRDWHDRYIVTRGKAWNVPPTNTLYKGDYSEIVATDAPPFETWWKEATPVPV
jgi:hypothetical protein